MLLLEPPGRRWDDPTQVDERIFVQMATSSAAAAPSSEDDIIPDNKNIPAVAATTSIIDAAVTVSAAHDANVTLGTDALHDEITKPMKVVESADDEVISLQMSDEGSSLSCNDTDKAAVGSIKRSATTSDEDEGEDSNKKMKSVRMNIFGQPLDPKD
jgi:hypothetical protein